MKVTQLACVLALLAATGVQAQGLSMPKQPAASSSRSAMPLVDAEVKKIELEKGLIILNHGEIPNLGMPAMTMGFDVVDRKMLEGIKVGQRVQFQAEMVKGKATVTELKKAR